MNAENTSVATVQQEQQVRKPVKIKEVHVHQRFHWDEVTAYALINLSLQGKSLFPYTGKGELILTRFIQEEVSHTDEEWDTWEILPLGCGGPSRFNEHGRPAGRKNLCSTKLVADYLGIAQDRCYSKLVEETLWADTHSGCSTMSMPNLLKVVHHCLKDNDGALFGWAFTAVEAIIINERFKPVRMTGERTLLQLFTERKENYADKRALQYVESAVRVSMNKQSDVTELSYVVSALYRRGYDDTTVVEWVRTALDSVYNGQLAFLEECDRLSKEATIVSVQAFLENRNRDLKLLIVNSDSPHTNGAARYLGAEVILVRNSTGNFQIYTNGKKVRDLNLSNVARMIRWLELPDGKKNLDWKRWLKLAQPENHPDVSNWYYFKDGEMLFNGSLTHVVTPTVIHMKALVEVLQHAFHPRGLWKWGIARDFDLEWMRKKSIQAKKQEAVNPLGDVLDKAPTK